MPTRRWPAPPRGPWPGPVVERLGSPDEGLRRDALRVLGRHPEWSGAAIDFIRARLRAADPGEADGLADLVLAFQDRADVQAALAAAAADPAAPAGRRA